MGQAKRRKDLGDYPDQSLKPRSETRIKGRYMGFEGGLEALALISCLNRGLLSSGLRRTVSESKTDSEH